MSTAPERIQNWQASWLGKLAPDEVHLYLCCLDWEENAIAWAGGVLSVSEKARADKLIDPIIRNYFSAARASLRWLLAQYLDLSPEEVVIQYASGGKPFVPGVYFNVSHSRDRALIAITKSCSVGVDLEFIDPDVSYWQVAELAFTPQERQALAAISGEEQRQVFYQMWTSKEAFLKAHGGKLDISLKEECSGVEAVDITTSCIRQLSLEEGWAGAMALTNPPSNVKLRYGFLV
jgi:4'-phosphopantetheinyl transferase